MQQDLKVSVCMITYGHEKYIREAIEGVLMQDCNFEVELILANDCSPDQTDEVIQDILLNHPKASWIKYFKHEKNIGMMPNFVYALEKCSGNYVALCEGDDYWTDPLKLQKQVEFMEANSEFVIHSAEALYLSENLETNGKKIHGISNNSALSIKDFLSGNKIITCTVLFRNTKIQFPDILKKLTFGDWFLYIVLMQKSGLKVYKSAEVFSVYRVLESGVMSSLSEAQYTKQHINQIIAIHGYVKKKDFNRYDFLVLENYFLRKFQLDLDKKLYWELIKNFSLQLRTLGLEMPFKKCLRYLKTHISKFKL